MKQNRTGLGLSVVWGALKDHEGYIDVSSEPGKGTTFTLFFPAAPVHTDRWEECTVDTSIGRGEKILVVDDDESQARLAELILTPLNYEVKTVGSGEEALAYLARHDVDLVVLDMIMDPGMDGYETYRRILEIKKQQKAIIVSGFTKTDRVHKAQNLGAGEFLMKPYLIEQLGIAVRKELDRK
jgi:CheY-like chemotaxis protein